MGDTRQYVILRSDDVCFSGTQLKELPDTTILASSFAFLLGGFLNYLKQVRLQTRDEEYFITMHRYVVIFTGAFAEKLHNTYDKKIYLAICRNISSHGDDAIRHFAELTQWSIGQTCRTLSYVVHAHSSSPYVHEKNYFLWSETKRQRRVDTYD